MGEGDFFGGDADVHQRPGVSTPAERGGHGVSVAGGVGDYGVEVSGSDLPQLFHGRVRIAKQDGVFDAVRLANEIEPRLDHVHHRNSGAGKPSEFQCGEADRASADDQRMVAGAWVATFVGVAADGECFDECQLFVVELC